MKCDITLKLSGCQVLLTHLSSGKQVLYMGVHSYSANEVVLIGEDGRLYTFEKKLILSPYSLLEWGAEYSTLCNPNCACVVNPQSGDIPIYNGEEWLKVNLADIVGSTGVAYYGQGYLNEALEVEVTPTVYTEVNSSLILEAPTFGISVENLGLKNNSGREIVVKVDSVLNLSGGVVGAMYSHNGVPVTESEIISQNQVNLSWLFTLAPDDVITVMVTSYDEALVTISEAFMNMHTPGQKGEPGTVPNVEDIPALIAYDSTADLVFVKEGTRGGLFKYIEGVAAVDNGVTFIATGKSWGYWERVLSTREVNVQWFGAIGDSTTPSGMLIQNALDYAESNTIRRVYVPTGNYLLEKTIYIPTDTEFFGDGMENTTFIINQGTSLDTLEMFDGTTHYQNKYTPLISTNVSRTSTPNENLLMRDFKIGDIFYDNGILDTQVCPLLILNTNDSSLERVVFGDVQTTEEQDGVTKRSLGLSVAFSQNILIRRVIHGFAGYEGLSIRMLSKNIKTKDNIFNIDKPLSLANMTHAVQVARPSSLISFLTANYGETKCVNYESEGDVFNLISNVGHAITTHSTDTLKIHKGLVNFTPNIGSYAVFKPFELSDNVTITDNTINLIDEGVQEGALYPNSILAVGTTFLNVPNRENSRYVISNNILNLTLNRDVSLLPERDISALIGNLRDYFYDTVITNNVVNITGTGVRDQAVFGVYGSNVVVSGNVVNFDGTVSTNMRAFVVEGGENINITNNTVRGGHEYSLKVNDDESLENLIVGANNFQEKILNSQPSKTKTLIYEPTIGGLPVKYIDLKIYGNPPSPPVTGDITQDLSGAAIGRVQKIYHEDTTEPAYPIGWINIGVNIYIPNELNIIYAEWVEDDKVEYWIVN